MKTILLILALAVGVSAQSIKEGKQITTWTFVSEGPLIKSYISPDSIKRGDDIIKVWMRFELPKGSRDLYANTPIDFGETRVYGMLNCKASKMQSKTMLVYDRAGNFYLGKENAGGWAEERPDSIGHSVFVYFCERGEKATEAPTLKP